MPREYPTLPNDDNLTNSPGVALAYRLPTVESPMWGVIAAALFSLVWNGVSSVLTVWATRSWTTADPEWLLSILLFPAHAVGAWSIYYFLRQLVVHTALGPTTVEVSNHPLYPGGRYELLISQTGHLRIQSFDVRLVCEEDVTYHQGTDIRHETRVVFEQDFIPAHRFSDRAGLYLREVAGVRDSRRRDALVHVGPQHGELESGRQRRGGTLAAAGAELSAYRVSTQAASSRTAAAPSAACARDRVAGGDSAGGERMTEPLISICLDQQKKHYQPGDELVCEYQVDVVDVADVQAVEASVLWFTEGKGDEDLSVHYFERRIPSDADDGDLRPLRRFRTRLPNSPLATAGRFSTCAGACGCACFSAAGKKVHSDYSFQLGSVPPAALPAEAALTNAHERRQRA